MPRLPISEQALRLALTRPTASSSQYVCRSCIRQYHPTPAFRAELPFWKRMTNALFGSPEHKVATEKRDEAHQKRLQDLAESGEGLKTELYVDDSGREWQIAAIVDPSINAEYVQAQRWDGLQWVGSKEWVARKSDAGEIYVGFNPRRQHEFEAHQWRRVLHHVAVEALSLVQAGRDVNALYTERAVRDGDWKRTAGVQIVETNGAIELQYATEEDRAAILKAVPQSLAEEIVKAAENVEAAAEEGVEEAPKPTTDARKMDLEEKHTMRLIRRAVGRSNSDLFRYNNARIQVPLADPHVKLAILKRVQQLTGHRLPDPRISSATSLVDLFAGYKVKCEPKKLADNKEVKSVGKELRNVTVYAHRRTPIHKDTEVGRWKVIEEELTNRGLPVTGSRWQGAKTTSPML